MRGPAKGFTSTRRSEVQVQAYAWNEAGHRVIERLGFLTWPPINLLSHDVPRA